MDKENILSNFQEKAKNAAPIGGTIKFEIDGNAICIDGTCLLYTSPSPRDAIPSRMPSSA